MKNAFVQFTILDPQDKLVLKAAELFASRWKDRTRVRLQWGEKRRPDPAWELLIGTAQQPVVRVAITAAGLSLSDQSHGYVIAAADRTLTVCGRDAHGVLYGLGHLLRNLVFAPQRVALPALRETRAPAVYNRGVYFATHFNNFYEAAPIEKIEAYIEEMALGGVDLLGYWFDANWFPHGFWNDPHSRGMRMIKRIRRIGATARACGMKVASFGIGNEGFANLPPPKLRADPAGRHGGFYLYSQICPSQPGGLKLILDVRKKIAELVGPVDIYTHWPYDQGGCGCAACSHAPGRWGKKFLEIGPKIAAVVRAANPNVQVFVSMWLMDEPERAMVYEQCDCRADWFQGIMVHAEQAGERAVDPRYARLVFPEISMFDCYFCSYGCNGANPAPQRFAAEAPRVARAGCGTLLYSEGMYEDLNKAVYVGLLWDPQRDVAEILEEYARYFFGPANIKTAVELIRGLETTWGAAALIKADPQIVANLAKQAESLKVPLPRHRAALDRWRMLRDRAAMDCVMKQAQPWKELAVESRNLFDSAEYIPVAELRHRVQRFVAALRQRKQQVDQLFELHWEYMRFFHCEKTVLIFLPDDVLGKYNFDPLIKPLAQAVRLRSEAPLRAAISRAFKRWHWLNGVDSNYLFM